MAIKYKTSNFFRCRKSIRTLSGTYVEMTKYPSFEVKYFGEKSMIINQKFRFTQANKILRHDPSEKIIGEIRLKLTFHS